MAAVLAFVVALSAPALVRAGPALLFEAQEGAILYEEDMDALWHPASLTKLMTAYLAFDAIREGEFTLDDTVVCSEQARAQAPSKIGLPLGAEMRVELALRTLIVKSANDVAVMLGEKVGGDLPNFIEMMNAKARELGMKRTRFVNPNGLPAGGQVTTARDMALLARAVIRDFPEYAWLFELEHVKVGKARMRSYNRLLGSYEGADGLKTGFICASGYNMVASATRDGRRLVAVVLGGRTGGERNRRAAELLDYGFRRYRWRAHFADRLGAAPAPATPGDSPRNLRAKVCG